MRTRITNARIVDGTGARAFAGDLLLEDTHIAEVGHVSLTADETVDARGMVVAPGFIDMHSHSDFTLPSDPLAEAKVMQGVTTEVVGNCGLGVLPANPRVDAMYSQFAPLIFGEQGSSCSESLDAYRARLAEVGVSVNAACLVPHGNVRGAAMGLAERAPTASELAHMRTLLDETMRQGAFGFSTGLVYPPGAFSEFDELAALARVIAPYGAFYASHIRDEGSRLVESVAEALRVGEVAGVGVQISHHKAVGIFNYGKVNKTLAMVDEARARGIDAHSDVYPYTAGATVLSAMLVPAWVFDGDGAQVIERLTNPETRRRIVRESEDRILKLAVLPFPFNRLPRKVLLGAMIAMLERVVVISSVRRHSEYEGKNLRQVRKMRGQPFYDAMLDMLVEEDVAVAAIAHVMSEKDVRTVMRHHATMIGTDGFPMRAGKPHPRTFGTYPRVLEHYVRELGVLQLEDAVHRMTGLPARKLGFKRRGTLAAGAAADVVMFDPDRVHDRATYREPRNTPLGIPNVWVNGAWTVRDGKHTGARAGAVLRKSAEG